MAIKYEVKKVVFGFDKTKTEKFVAQTKMLGMVEFKKLCEEVQKVSMAPRGVVKVVPVKAAWKKTLWDKRLNPFYYVEAGSIHGTSRFFY